MPVALLSRAAAEGLARSVGQGLGPRGLPEGCNSPKVHGSQPGFLIRRVESCGPAHPALTEFAGVVSHTASCVPPPTASRNSTTPSSAILNVRDAGRQ